jgi:DMSO/TMAO reductase YedYZ molybdopterin-dependent catalytic subunit
MSGSKFTKGRRGIDRRDFLGAVAAGAAGLAAGLRTAAGAEIDEAASAAVAKLPYLTPPGEFRTFVREKPRIDQFPPEKLREVGLDRETWRLEVVPDPESDSKVERPLSRERGTALDWTGLMRLAENRAVRFLHVLSCTNMEGPLGMGLWEGVPLRDVLALARPAANVRRVWFHGYHNDETKQRFQASLSIDRILEDPPGEPPVILCTRLNGQPLSPASGGPVRMAVPGLYANRWIKWLTRVVLTNDFRANDTYATWGNDVESPLKTCSRFIDPPAKAKAGAPVSLAGLAQVGLSGLGKVQMALAPRGAPLPEDDPFLGKLDWKDARILPPPEDWGGGLTGGRLPAGTFGCDTATGRPLFWPLRWTIVHWSAVLGGLAPGKYDLRCRTVDGAGSAQPQPRHLPRSGENAIQKVELEVEA